MKTCKKCRGPIEAGVMFAMEMEAVELVRHGGGRTYFFRAHDFDRGCDVVKIGSTSGDVHQRITALLRGGKNVVTPEGVDIRTGELVGVIIGGRPVEKALHGFFGDNRIEGEWFRLDENLEFLIELLVDQFCADEQCCPSGAADLMERRREVIREAIDWSGEVRTFMRDAASEVEDAS